MNKLRNVQSFKKLCIFNINGNQAHKSHIYGVLAGPKSNAIYYLVYLQMKYWIWNKDYNIIELMNITK